MDIREPPWYTATLNLGIFWLNSYLRSLNQAATDTMARIIGLGYLAELVGAIDEDLARVAQARALRTRLPAVQVTAQGRAFAQWQAEDRRAPESFLRRLSSPARLIYADALARTPLSDRPEEPSPDEIVTEVESRGDLSASTRYNLACYFAGRASPDNRYSGGMKVHEDWDRAMAQLTLALDALPKARIMDDPSLAALRRARPVEFAKLAKAGTEDSLASRVVVGPRLAAQLDQVFGIATCADLLPRSLTVTDRLQLANRLRVHPTEVFRWARIAEVVHRVDGLSVADANLLAVAGIASIEGLQAAIPEALANVLKGAAFALADSPRPPPDELIDAWINEATGLRTVLTPRVS